MPLPFKRCQILDLHNSSLGVIGKIFKFLKLISRKLREYFKYFTCYFLLFNLPRRFRKRKLINNYVKPPRKYK